MNQRAFASVGAAILISLGAVLLVAAVWNSRTNAAGDFRQVTYVADAFTFSAPQALLRPAIPGSPGVQLKDQDTEPEIKVDLFGNIYVTAIHGVPGGVDLWKSTDKGTTFVYLGEPDGAQDKCNVAGTLPCTVGAGGGDDSIDVSSGGYLYVSSLYLGSVTMSTSFDGGTGGTQPNQAWQVNPASSNTVVNDRQWIAAFGPQAVYMTFDQAPVNSGVWFTKSTDAGKTFSPATNLTGVASLSRENNVAVDQYNGNIYTTYTPTGKPNELHLLKSTDAGATFSNSIIYAAPTGQCLENAFPIIAVDKGGNVHVVFTESTGCGPTPLRANAHVFLVSSANAGGTWTAPLRIDSNNSTVMPWVVAGGPGIVNITWYGSTMASPDAVPANQSEWWGVFFAQVTNALSATPTVSASLVAGAVHDKPICSRGGNCTGNTRDLAEYYTMTIDGDGNANIAYVDEVNYCAAHPATNCFAHTFFTRQTSGPGAFAPPAPPPPATFAANVPMPGSTPGSIGGGAEPGIKVDSHNCIYTTAPGNPFVWRSTDLGLTFSAPVNPVADEPTLTGGDEEILPFPPNPTGRDPLYFGDLGLSSVHVRKSTDGGATWFKPGTGGAAGDVAVSSDRQWFAGDRAPGATDVTIYEMDHELASEDIRFHSLTNDTAWSGSASGITSSELILPPDSTFPNTNPGPVLVDKATHQVFGFFNASTLRNNANQPPFGKMPNVWEAVGPGSPSAGVPPGPFTNFPVFKGVFDSPTAPAPPPGAQTFGTNVANDFPSAAIDNAGNLYAVWAMNNARTNRYAIWFASSHDHGKTFYGPFEVSQGIGAAVMPWIAAGDNGLVDIVYYATNAAVDPNTVAIGDKNVPWTVFFAQSVNASAREPVFTVSQASDHVNHYGVICNLGLLCASGTRTLLDYFQVAIGPDGLANIVYADDATLAVHPVFARQNSGRLALTSPVPAQCISASPTPTATATATPASTPTATPAATATATPAPTATATPSATATSTPAATPNASPTATPSATATSTPAATATASPSATATATPLATATASPTATPSATATSTPAATATATATPTATPTPTIAPTPQPTPANVQLLNISGRARVDTGDNISIAGFIISGERSKRIVVRGIGPSMTSGGAPVLGRLQDPIIELRDNGGRLIRSNNDWRSDQPQEIQTTGLAPSDDRESAIVLTLPPDTYTVILRGTNNSTGIGLIEVYDVSPNTDSELGNLSVRANVLTNDNVLIDGLILRGGVPKRVLFRAIGPELNGVVAGALQDPTMELHGENGALLMSNDDWRNAPNAADILATGLAPKDERESAILVTLPPANYTAIVRGKNNATGVALNEAYKLP